MKIQLKKYDVLASTNETAAKAACQGADEGTIIVATRQEGGHGRMQRVWNSPKGGLWFTIVLRPKIDPMYVPQVTLLMGVAVAQGLRRLYSTDKISIKWPNDILWDGRKVCGILSEMQLDANGDIDHTIVGVGVNVAFSSTYFPEAVRPTAAVLSEVSGKSFTCEDVLQAILTEFEPIYEAWQREGSEAMLKRWCSLNCTLGKYVNVKDNDEIIFQGTAVSIDEEGALKVKSLEGKIRSYNFGEISIR